MYKGEGGTERLGNWFKLDVSGGSVSHHHGARNSRWKKTEQPSVGVLQLFM